MYVALAEVEVFSTISIFLPLASTSAPVYPLPPPTTLVGALAYAYLRSRDADEYGDGSSPAVKLLKHIIYATAGAEGYQTVREVERIYQAIYQRKERWSEEYMDYWYTIGVRGAISYLDNKLYILYISKDLEVLKHVYGIVRIGRKEGHVAVRKVVIDATKNLVKSIGRGVFRTAFYTPKSIAYCTESTSIVLSLPKLTQSNFMQSTTPHLEEYFVPRESGAMECELRNNGVMLSIKGLDIAVPREYIG